MKLFFRLSLLSFCFVFPVASFAWGLLGHRIVGQIADSYLTAKARSEIQKILGTESVAMSSNWADFIKSDTAYRYLNSWHYINFKSGLSGDDVRAYLKADTATDVYTRVNFIVKELKKGTLAFDKKRLYLRLLIHFVGDIHQPMHTGRPDDLGGNRVRVQWFGNNSNLHAVWDEALIEHQELSYTEYAAVINHPTLKQRQAWQKSTLSDWIGESYNIAETLYPQITEKDQKLSYDYNFRHIQIVNDQLLKGGIRLAGLLNAIFR